MQTSDATPLRAGMAQTAAGSPEATWVGLEMWMGQKLGVVGEACQIKFLDLGNGTINPSRALISFQSFPGKYRLHLFDDSGTQSHYTQTCRNRLRPETPYFQPCLPPRMRSRPSKLTTMPSLLITTMLYQQPSSFITMQLPRKLSVVSTRRCRLATIEVPSSLELWL